MVVHPLKCKTRKSCILYLVMCDAERDPAWCCRRHPRACRAPTSPRSVAAQASVAVREPASAAVQLRALRSVALDGEVVVSHTTHANLHFARNWYQHLQRAGVRNYALIATDDEALSALSYEIGPRHVVQCPRSIFDGAGDGSAQQTYRSRGWTKLMFAVPRMLRWVLSAGLHVLWMDTDVVTVRDPFPLLHRLAAQAAPSAPLLLASVDGRVPDEDLHECSRRYTVDARWGKSSGTSKLCGGLFYMRSSAATVALARDWEARVRAPGAGKKNQPHFNDAIEAARNVTAVLLPCAAFPNGYRYASHAWRRAQPQPPVLVHNNWIKGHAAKLERFREWGMWLPAGNASSSPAAPARARSSARRPLPAAAAAAAAAAARVTPRRTAAPHARDGRRVPWRAHAAPLAGGPSGPRGAGSPGRPRRVVVRRRRPGGETAERAS